jgi:benzoate-CoA ligase family protein
MRRMPSPAHNLAARLVQGALDRGLGDKVALREGERSWTYAQLADQVTRFASALRTLKIGRGERVAMLVRDTLEGAAAILGTIHAGAVAVPMSELARAHDIKTYLEHCGAVAAVVDDDLARTLDEARAEVADLREILVVGDLPSGEGVSGDLRDFAAVVAAAVPGSGAQAVEPGDMCVILYSAGVPTDDLRGVAHSHATPMAAWESFGKGLLGLTENDRVFSIARFATAFGLGTSLVFPLAAGAESLLLPVQPRSDEVFEVVANHKPTVLCGTPSLYGQLARDAAAADKLAPLASKPLAGLRIAASGGEGMPDKLVGRIREALGTEVTVGYGLTELLSMVFAGSKPLPGIQARVVDEDGTPVGADEIGTLELKSPSMFIGYWGGTPEDDAFRDGWFTTRDRFLVDQAGVFHHCGRVDDLFKVGGKWVSPVEVERALTAHEAVWECAVIGADDEDGLIKPFAFVVTNVGHDATPALEEELREYVKNELAPYKYPRWIEFVPGLPRGPGGKLLRYKLKPARGRRRRAETAGPGGEAAE